MFNYWARCENPRLEPARRIEYCERLLNTGGGPNSEVAILTIMGGLYRDMHQYSTAIDTYSRALGYEELGVSDLHASVDSPGSTISIPTVTALVGALEGRAEVYALTGQGELALADAAHVFRLAPDLATSYAIRCRTRAILKTDLDKALADCNQAEKLAPKDTQVLGAAGFLQYRMDHPKDAAVDFDQALSVSPKLAGALYMRGIIELHSGNSAGGNADIAAAKEEDPAIADSFVDLGVTP
jgi:tetratricopeptide (TPR) repeat protein